MNLLNEASDSKFLTRKWNIANDQSNANYDVGNKIIYSTEVSKSDLENETKCNFHHFWKAFIEAKNTFFVEGESPTLTPCFKFSETLMLLFIDKVTTRT